MKQKKKNTSIEEVLNRLLSTSPEDMEAARKQADKMLEFSNKLIDEVAEFAKDSVD